MNELNEVMAIPVNIKQHTIWIRTDIDTNAQKLLTTTSMRIHPKIFRSFFYLPFMPVRKAITEKEGGYFIAFTCINWLTLFKICN